MRSHRLLTLLLLAACTPVQSGSMEFVRPDPQPATPLETARNVIRARDVDRRIAWLASDRMRGRDTPSPELDSAAAYLAAEFGRIGLRPAGDDSYLQYWRLQRSALDADQVHLEFRAGSLSIAPRYAHALAAVGGGDAIQAEAVFVGPAEDAPTLMLAAEGRVAIALLAGSAPAEWRWPATIGRVAQAAARARAGAVVFIADPDFGPAGFAQAAAAFEGPVNEPSPVPLFFVDAATGAELFRAAGMDPATTQVPATMAGVLAQADAPLTPVDTRAPNVVALLPGADSARAEEYVILSAHFDHIGVGAPDAHGDSIYNGADDNASGTAALIEIAEAFAALPAPPARPVLFLGVSGEEKGLLGSQWFAANPTVFLTDAIADLNIDMIGRNDPGEVVVIGHDYSSLGPLFDSLTTRNPDLGLAVVTDPAPEQSFFTRSDHYNFATRGIPSVLITTHLHEDYHTPADEAGRVDADKVARIARLVFLAALELANGEQPAWTEAGRAAVRRQ